MRCVYFLLDENADPRLGDALRARGHEVESAREVYPNGTRDEVLAAHVDVRGGLIVTGDRDFVRLIARHPAGNVLRWRRAGRVFLSCAAYRGLPRLMAAVHLLEAEHAFLQTQPDPRMIVEVGAEVIRVER